LAEEVVPGEVVVVHDPEDELVLHVGRGGADLELEHLVPARVPPLICITTRFVLFCLGKILSPVPRIRKTISADVRKEIRNKPRAVLLLRS
jgi:hypothetical protein